MKGHWITVTRREGRDLAGRMPRSLLVQFEPDVCKITDIKITDPNFPHDFAMIRNKIGGMVAKEFNGRDWDRRAFV